MLIKLGKVQFGFRLMLDLKIFLYSRVAYNIWFIKPQSCEVSKTTENITSTDFGGGGESYSWLILLTQGGRRGRISKAFCLNTP